LIYEILFQKQNGISKKKKWHCKKKMAFQKVVISTIHVSDHHK